MFKSNFVCFLLVLLLLACGSQDNTDLPANVTNFPKVTSSKSPSTELKASPTPKVTNDSTQVIPKPTPTVSLLPNPTPKPSPTASLLSDPEDFSVFTNFANINDNFLFGYVLGLQGTESFNVYDNNAIDKKIAKLTYLGNVNQSGPGYSTQLESYHPDYFYGIYQTRFKTATCSNSNEGVVSAFFLYFNDGKDYNNNGLADNIEIDIEILCAEPQTVYMSIWTDYQDGNNFIKNTRKINLATGKYFQTKAGQESQWGLNSSGSLSYTLPSFKPNTQYVEMGFEWFKNSVRFYLVDQGQQYELWNFKNTNYIPHHAAYLMFNLWHNESHWHNDAPAQTPTKAVQLSIDYFAHQPIAD